MKGTKNVLYRVEMDSKYEGKAIEKKRRRKKDICSKWKFSVFEKEKLFIKEKGEEKREKRKEI